jgi:succinate dehydrogenase / fumarate reductase iron-sulfur subunit
MSATKTKNHATKATLSIFRGDSNDAQGNHIGQYQNYDVPIQPGWVVLDAVHWVQANLQPDLAVRWNCKAAKCGSCGGEVNGFPSLMCKTRLDEMDLSKPVTIRPMKTFPLIRDLVTDVSWNYEVNKKIQPFTPLNPDSSTWRYYQEEADRVQEFRKCIECFLCQNVCHVLRHHSKFDAFYGPRFMIRLASLDMHPLDGADRMKFIKEQAGIGYCNITKCCTEVCPEEIRITDNAIIPLKERVVDRFYDPITMALQKLGLAVA